MTQLIDFDKLKKDLPKIKKGFSNANPYPHVMIKVFFKKRAAEDLLKKFPSIEQMQASSAFSGVAEKKSQLSDVKKMPKIFQQVFKELMSPEFRSLISSISGIKTILPDPDLKGGGLHQGTSGSFLDIHADFNKHPATGKFRRLNILIYLNKNWKDNYGGQLEVWSKDMKRCEKKVAPIFNRCLIFATDKNSNHGYAKMNLPEGVTRKSIAAYYYSDHPAADEDWEYHNTLFRARPMELRNKILYPLMTSKFSQRLRSVLKKLS